MKGRNTTVVRVRMPDGLLAMVVLSARLSGKSVTETINAILSEHYHFVDDRWKEVSGDESERK